MDEARAKALLGQQTRRWMTIVVPGGDAPTETMSHKWRVQQADESKDGVTQIGSRYFDTLREALLYVYKTDHGAWRIVMADGTVHLEDRGHLSVSMAKSILYWENASFGPLPPPVTPEPLREGETYL